MKFTKIVFSAALAFKVIISKKSTYTYITDDFKYNFHCLEDNNDLCKFLKNELHQAVDNISEIIDIEPPTKFEAFVDDLSKYRLDNTKEIFAVILNNEFTPLLNNANIKSPYPNYELILKQININDNNDFIVVLNNFKSDQDYIKDILNDVDESIVVEMFEGLKALNKIGYPYVNNNRVNSIEFEFNYYLEKRLNVSAIYETAVEVSSSCKKVSELDNLHNIMYWEDTLISKGKKESQENEYKRVIAVGDIHGDYKKLIKVLRHAKLIDKKNNWIGEDSILVQTGDLMNRGDDTKKIYELMIRIRDQAKMYGGIVYLLLGNHELLEVQGNHYFTTIGDYDSFGGFENREKEFSIEGKFGQLIRKEMNITMIVDDIIFAHAGITSNYIEMGIDKINKRAHEILTNTPSYEELYKIIKEGKDYPLYTDPIFDRVNSPLWLRDFAINPESEICPEVEKALELSNTKRMVVGHTIQPYGHITSRCQNKLILIDIGMSDCLGGYYGYLEILNDKQEVWARYLD